MTIYVNAYSAMNALGRDPAKMRKSLGNWRNTPLRQADGMVEGGGRSCFGFIDGDFSLPEDPRFASRLCALLKACLESLPDEGKDLVSSCDPSRLAVVMATSTSGSLETQRAHKLYLKHERDPRLTYFMHEFGSPSMYVAAATGAKGTCCTISTACSSSALAVSQAARLIRTGMADVVIAGGADTLCALPINGFASMGVLSDTPCAPFCEHRHGISIGEAAGIMILSKKPSALFVAGCGESSDAYHVSSPDPSGAGAAASMRAALKAAGLKPSDIGYLNLHGTGTRLNDSMEAKAVSEVFGLVPCSSTKYLTGHTLAAAGITEAVICCEILKGAMMPPQDFTRDCADPKLPEIGLLCEERPLQGRFAMSNSFAFGGSNASLIFGRA